MRRNVCPLDSRRHGGRREGGLNLKQKREKGVQFGIYETDEVITGGVGDGMGVAALR